MVAARHVEVVAALQVRPEFGRDPEEPGQAQRRIAGDGALAVDDPGDAVLRNADGLREPGGGNAEWLQERLAKDPARMGRLHGLASRQVGKPEKRTEERTVRKRCD